MAVRWNHALGGAGGRTAARRVRAATGNARIGFLKISSSKANLAIEYRWSMREYDLGPKMVDLVRQAAVIVAAGYDAAAAAKVTTTIGAVAL
jgi:hypothetical protein